MSENAKKNLEDIIGKVNALPKDVAAVALEQYAARVEGFTEGFAAGLDYAKAEVK